eukprot:jgi/Mesvir1/7464/Mv25817-RA.1
MNNQSQPGTTTKQDDQAAHAPDAVQLTRHAALHCTTRCSQPLACLVDNCQPPGAYKP